MNFEEAQVLYDNLTKATACIAFKVYHDEEVDQIRKEAMVSLMPL